MIFSHEEHGGSSIVLIFKSFPNFRGYKAYVLALLCWGLLAAQSVDAQEGYSIQNIEGWPVWVSDELKVKEPEATAVALDCFEINANW